MLIPLPSYRLEVGLALVTLIFVAYGVHEAQEAMKYGTSTRDGLEAIAIGGVFASILIVTLWVKHRRRAERRKFPHRQ